MSPADWPFRESQIRSLTSLVQQPHMPLIYVSGEPSTGKTEIVRYVGPSLQAQAITIYNRHVLQQAPHKMIYINCMEHKRQNQVARALVSQLKVRLVVLIDPSTIKHSWQTHKRKKHDTYMTADTTNIDVFEHLPQLLANDVSAYVVLDAPEHLEDPALVPMLQRLSELLDVRMGLLLISQLPWGSEHLRGRAAALPMPAVVHLPQYTADQATTILQRRVPDGVDKAAFAQLVATLVPPLWRRTRLLRDMRLVLHQLLPCYLQLWREHGGRVRDVYAGFKSYLKRTLDEVATGEGCPSVHTWDHVSRSGKTATTFDLDLPYLAKFLLLAGYIASRNKPSVDRRLFATGGGRLRGRAQYDRQAAEAAAVATQGPGTFTRERLLAVFWALLQLEGGQEDEELLDDSLRMAADVLQQVSSLVRLRLFVHVGGNVLEGGTYRCEVSDEMARWVATNVDLTLDNYVMYA